MDLDALREALGRVPRYDLMLLRTDSPIVAAARAVLDSEEVWRCETHGSDGTAKRCWRKVANDLSVSIDPLPGACSMVRVRLLAEEGT